MDQHPPNDESSDQSPDEDPELEEEEEEQEQEIDYEEEQRQQEGAYREYLSQLRAQQSLPMGIVGGLGASLVGAAAWAGVTVATGYQIGWMAVGVGFLVGMGVRMLGKGIDSSFGIVGAAFALFGCILGNIGTVIGLGAQQVGIDGVLAMLTLGKLMEIMVESFEAMDLLFYGIAVYEGFKLSILNTGGE